MDIYFRDAIGTCKSGNSHSGQLINASNRMKSTWGQYSASSETSVENIQTLTQ